MTDDHPLGRVRGARSHVTRPVTLLAGASVAGAGFGAATSVANAVSDGYADLESAAYTTSGWSVAEIISVLFDSGWAWAGLAVAAGWLVTRAGENGRSTLAQGAAVGALALVAAVAAYGVGDTIRGAGSFSWFEALVWWVAGVVLGGPLGAIGACVRRPGVIGLLARLTVPVGAATQMAVRPPGRNAVVQDIGQTVVWTAAAACICLIVVHFLRAQRHRRTPNP